MLYNAETLNLYSHHFFVLGFLLRSKKYHPVHIQLPFLIVHYFKWFIFPTEKVLFEVYWYSHLMTKSIVMNIIGTQSIKYIIAVVVTLNIIEQLLLWILKKTDNKLDCKKRSMSVNQNNMMHQI